MLYYQLLAHLWGDYILQNDWMATNKHQRTWPCVVHCLAYTACFLPFEPSLQAAAVIFGSHFILDRFPVTVRGFIWLKNQYGPNGHEPLPYRWCARTGFFDDLVQASPPEDEQEKMAAQQASASPIWLRVWLGIIIDNTLHLTCNALALGLL